MGPLYSLRRWFAALVVICLLPVPILSQQLAKRLILKDGTYQLVSEWQVKGDRVRYFSVERGEWEEVPSSMVDWPATDKYQKDRTSGVPLPEAVEFDKRVAAERAAEEAKRPEVAAGLRLPANGGVVLLDKFENQPQLVALEQKIVRLNSGKNDHVDIAGPHADVQAHATVPVLYVKIESAPAEGADADSLDAPSERFQLVRTQARKDRRVVQGVSSSPNDKLKEMVPASVEPIAEGWLKIVPFGPLAAGEYGLVELKSGKGEVNTQGQNLPDNIWDFGVNPSAPPNPLAVKPEVPAKSPADQPPPLQTRP
jgi:hypothetical protein